jgi:kynureninase
MASPNPFVAFRERFHIPSGTIYLDGNSLGVLPKATAARVADTVEREWGNDLIRSWNSADWINTPTRVGDKYARLMGANAGEVAACDTTSINVFKAILTVIELQKDTKRNVIVSDIDNFPTDLYIAQGLKALLAERNLDLRFVKREQMSETIDAAGEQLALTMLTEVDYRTGERYDMKRVTAHVQSKGALMMWDLAHSLCAFPVALNDCNVDLAVGCGYKYVNGGPGAPAFIFVAKRHLETLDAANAPAPISGWFAHEAPFAFQPEFKTIRGIKRFSVGTPPILQMAALECALDIWLEADLHAVRTQSILLADLFIREVETRCGSTSSPRTDVSVSAAFSPVLDTGSLRVELTLATPREHERRGSQVSFRHPEGYAIMQALIARNVIGDFRAPDILRFGFTPLYISENDVVNAAQHLAEILATREWDQPKFKMKHAVT